MRTDRRSTLGVGIAGALIAITCVGPAQALRPRISVHACPSAAGIGDAEIVYLGQYGGAGPKLPYSFKGGGSEANLAKVVGVPDKRTFFVVSAYESTVWDFSSIDPSLVAGVHASGFYEQGVSGLRSGVPITLRHQFADTASDPAALKDGCLDLGYQYTPQSAETIERIISVGVGRRPSYALIGYAVQAYDLNQRDGMPIASISTIPNPSYIVSENPMNVRGLQPGRTGIRQLVSAGTLVPLNNELARGWVRSGLLVRTGPMAKNPPASQSKTIPLNDSYVVTRSVSDLPKGLYGANLVNFVLPPGVNAPVDMPTHSSFYRYIGPPVDWKTKTPTDWPATIDKIQDRRTSSERVKTPRYRIDWTTDGFSAVTPLRIGDPYDPTDPRRRFLQEDMIRRMEMNSHPPVETSNAVVQPTDQGMSQKQVLFLIALLCLAISQRRRLRMLVSRLNGVEVRIAKRHQQNKQVVQTNATPGQDMVTSSNKGHDDVPVSGPAKVPASGSKQRVMHLTADVIDVTEDDATIAEVSRLRRDLTAAMSRSWDGDIASEIEALVRHCSTAAAEYLVVRARTSMPEAAPMEASLLEASRSIRHGLRGLVERQGRRDAGSVATQEGFIRRRHGPDELGVD